MRSAICSKDGGLHGDRKPVFVKQPQGKANPPLENMRLVTAARYCYDQTRVEFFPPARFEDAKKLGVARKELKLPRETFKNPFLKTPKKEYTIGPSTTWGTRK